MNDKTIPLGVHGDPSWPMYFTKNQISKHSTIFCIYEGQLKITKPYLITFKLSKMDRYLGGISLT